MELRPNISEIWGRSEHYFQIAREQGPPPPWGAQRIPERYRWYLISFRARNHRLPVETGRWQNIELQERKCNLCSNVVGDEFHYMLVCDKLKEQRQNFLKACFYKRPNTLKYDSLMNS